MMTTKHVCVALAASVFAVVIATDNADARRGGGGGMRGAGGGGMRAAGSGFRGGRAHVSHPIARPGIGNRPGWGVAGGGYRPGYGYGRYRPGYGWGAAAVGAAAGAGLAYSNGYYGGYYGDGYYDNGSYASGDYASTSDAVAYCAQRFRSYDIASQTYLSKNGRRVSCP